MKKTAYVIAALCCMMALVVGFASCNNNPEDTPSWTEISSLDGLDGTWKLEMGEESSTFTVSDGKITEMDGQPVGSPMTLADMKTESGASKAEVNKDKTEIRLTMPMEGSTSVTVIMTKQ